MCLFNNRAIILALAIGFCFTTGARSEDVESFLSRHGLSRLLATHLEMRLQRASGDDRSALTAKLARTYARLLESSGDPELVDDIVKRSRALLADAPGDEALELQLALVRGKYRKAERLAENHRLRLTTEAELNDVRTQFGDLIRELDQIRMNLKRELDTAERRLSRSGDAQATLIFERLEDIKQLYLQCVFLNGWSLYYNGWLNDREQSFMAAEERFSILLNSSTPRPSPDDISVDLRSHEAVARAILGVALCRSLAASGSTLAHEWLDLLEDEATHQAVRQELPAWRMLVHMEHDEFSQAYSILRDAVAAEEPAPVSWIRLAAVYGLEDAGANQQAVQLAQLAVTELASRGELSQVLELGRMFGMDSLGARGFAMRYVDGVQTYEAARIEHEQAGSINASVQEAYDRAVATLREALGERDADRFDSAMADCHHLIGWCLYFSQDWAGAARAFEESAGRLSAERAAEALWMAIVALQKTVSDTDEHLQQLVDAFIERFPSNEHTATLLVRRAVTSTATDSELISQLLNVPRQSDAYFDAQSQASRLLYQLYRDAIDAQRLHYASQFLSAAGPLLVDLSINVNRDEPRSIDSFLLHARRVLEVSLDQHVQRVVAAQQALETIDDVVERERVDITSIENELDFRRLQERLYSGAFDEAQRIVQLLSARTGAEQWAESAARAAFLSIVRSIEANDSSVGRQPDRALLELAVELGRTVIKGMKSGEQSLQSQRTQSYYSRVAGVAMLLWQTYGNDSAASFALRLYRDLLDAKPRDVVFLTHAGLLAEAQGDDAFALRCWRTLLSGSRDGSDRWFDAKVHVISLLAATDPARARRVLDQHKQLHPEFGPEPYGTRLRALDRKLPQAGGA